MILPRLGPPRDPARTYHRRRFHDVSDGEWTFASSDTPGASCNQPRPCIKTCKNNRTSASNIGWSGLGQDAAKILLCSGLAWRLQMLSLFEMNSMPYSVRHSNRSCRDSYDGELDS